MTNETKYTQGKWVFGGVHELHVCKKNEDDPPHLIDYDQQICTLYRRPEMRANARLISKAPELLNALEDMVEDKCENCDESLCETHGCPFLRYKQLIASVKEENGDDE